MLRDTDIKTDKVLGPESKKLILQSWTTGKPAPQKGVISFCPFSLIILLAYFLLIKGMQQSLLLVHSRSVIPLSFLLEKYTVQTHLDTNLC